VPPSPDTRGMPPEVDFYLVDSGRDEERLRCACRIAEKGWREGYRVRIAAADTQHAGMLDGLLWTFRQDSFVPHRVDGAMVLIDAPGSKPALAINVTDAGFPGPPEYARLAEVVGSAGEARAAARARYREYRERGWTLRTHEL